MAAITRARVRVRVGLCLLDPIYHHVLEQAQDIVDEGFLTLRGRDRSPTGVRGRVRVRRTWNMFVESWLRLGSLRS